MGRPASPDFHRTWKVHLEATVAGTVEAMLLDPVHNKPRYSSRSRLLQNLLEIWIARQRKTEEPPMLTLEQLRELTNA